MLKSFGPLSCLLSSPCGCFGNSLLYTNICSLRSILGLVFSLNPSALISAGNLPVIKLILDEL